MNKSNQSITFKGNKIAVQGREVHEGDSAPDFKLTGGDMQDVAKSKYGGKVLVLSVVPSVDTPVCALQTKRFNKEATSMGSDVVILTVSVDLPFALKRFCAAEGLSNVEVASDFKYRNFGENYGVYMPDLGILARAIFVIDKSGKVKHVEYVSEVANEPDYDAALKAVAAAK